MRADRLAAANRQSDDSVASRTRSRAAPTLTNGPSPVTPLQSLLIHEPADVYHSKSGEFLSSHRLADFRRCPQLYYRKLSGALVDDDGGDRPAYLIGRAAHTLILEGDEAFDQTYATGGPVNERTGQPFGSATKAFAEWAAAQGKPVLTLEQATLVEQMCVGVRSHDLAKQLLDRGVAEGVVRAAWQGVACQIRIDFLTHAAGGAIVDLKTTDDLTWFEADARRFQYAHQLAFYRSVLAAAALMDPREIPVHMIAVEKRQLFRAGVWKLGEEALGIAQRENEQAVHRLKQCVAAGVYPTGYEQIRTLDWAG
jgi:hypothetical protein